MHSYRYGPSQELHLLSILARSASRQASGCLHVTDGGQTWMVFLEQGKLVYATSSVDPFGRLDRQLRRLSHQIPTLASPIRVQVRLLFEKPMEDASISCKDYEAICWLVEQRYLTDPQAGELIEVLAKETLETLLPLQYGNYNWLDENLLGSFPKFCRLELRSLVEACHARPTRRTSLSSTEGRKLQMPVRSLPEPDLAARPQPATGLRQPATESRQPDTSLRQPEPAMPAPTQIPPTPPAGSAGMMSPAPRPGPLSKTTYTIACIDDSPTVLRAIEAFLDDKAFKVLQIENPVSALMQIIRNKPDLILLDVTMPSLDGYELCSLLRRHPAFKQTPIIMVTGNRSLIDRAKAKLVGASGYLTKPFTQPDLLKIIFKYLS